MLGCDSVRIKASVPTADHVMMILSLNTVTTESTLSQNTSSLKHILEEREQQALTTQTRPTPPKHGHDSSRRHSHSQWARRRRRASEAQRWSEI